MDVILTIVLFFFATIGLTHIIVDSVFFDPIRRFFDWLSGKCYKKMQPWWRPRNILGWLFEKIHYMLTCYQCAGFWCGLFAGWVFFGNNPWIILMCGFASSYLSTWGAYHLVYLESKTIVDLPEENDE
jgi:hypothetical protein